ncbi:unnamed protein product [Leptidea sinapis]|uniref:Uncharacterized protein n=1 Tax=Leptidea sinapis TaxID=189913 RepID=A0A5E4QU55_9NEOP|nr:unnamed protein product [Leptidea sinapis]
MRLTLVEFKKKTKT